jgi:hypothetical protein
MSGFMIESAENRVAQVLDMTLFAIAPRAVLLGDHDTLAHGVSSVVVINL